MPFSARSVRFVCFDADDTLWKNEEFYRQSERDFARLMAPFLSQQQAIDRLFQTEMDNLETFGYGAKSCMLSMMQTALEILPPQQAAGALKEILQIGRRLILHPVEVLPGVKDTLEKLTGKYHLSVITKGDLLDQQRKLERSGLQPLFNHVEIVSDKTPAAYRALFVRLNAKPQEVLMVGNSLRSDIFPALQAGAQAAYQPSPFNWKHEEMPEPQDPPYLKIASLPDLLPVLL
ncbi:HAD family hydrolase [Candidatus Avelusimicrobium gallicola]|uniref:HAD family hydrolase n=1 Tax=Candidatus Avelusimicrobium gallicola TaxID=2562704 RepID=A0A1Y4DEG8_9BACT|nr:HAD family hydrolase [Elusimicrobium sp. An273]OUO57544.1 hypothetical protein B5F75_01865 [Elusimicrobium sp. An273]